GVPFFPHLDFNFLLIFADDRDGQAECNDGEIDGCPVRRERNYPTTLAAAVIADSSEARAGEAPRLAHGFDGVVRQDAEVLGVRARRTPRSPFVVDEGADTGCG